MLENPLEARKKQIAARRKQREEVLADVNKVIDHTAGLLEPARLESLLNPDDDTAAVALVQLQDELSEAEINRDELETEIATLESALLAVDSELRKQAATTAAEVEAKIVRGTGPALEKAQRKLLNAFGECHAAHKLNQQGKFLQAETIIRILFNDPNSKNTIYSISEEYYPKLVANLGGTEDGLRVVK